MTELILHAANLDHEMPPGSLPALEKCLQAGVPKVEVDIIPMKDGDFALLHDPKLENVSDEFGNVSDQMANQLQSIKFRNSNHYLGTLRQAIALLQKYPMDGFLQLDLKPYAPLTPGSLTNLVKIIEPVREMIMVSTVADWAVRTLRKISPNLLLGFDPLLYLDLVEEEPREAGVPPFRVGAYGYLDEHPLAAQRWGEKGDYFAARAEALIQQVPSEITWFINAQLLDEMMDAGFNCPKYLHENGNLVDAWTIDMDRTDLALRMVKLNVDYITTNYYYEMGSFLGSGSLI